jgi:hypothetical protein
MTEKEAATKVEATAITVVLPDNRKFDLAPEMAKQDAETIRKALRGTAPEIALSKVEKDEIDAQGHRTLQFVKEVTRKG